MFTRFPAGSLVASLCLAALASAQTPPGPKGVMQARLSPLIPLETFSQMGMRFATDTALVQALDGALDIRLENITVPSPTGFVSLDLALSRVDPVADSAILQVDGKVAGGAELLREGVSLWTGVVIGEEGTDVYLAFTPTGTRGWITREDGRSHFFALPGANGDWNDTSTVLVHEDDIFVQQNTPTWTCETDTSNMSVGLEDEDEEGGHALHSMSGLEGYTGQRLYSSTGVGSIECKIAVETDFQYYQLFNNLTAATNYAVSMWGAISCRFIDATNTYITVPVLSIYTNSNDPWNTPDVGGSSSQMLNEFQRYYKFTGFPAGAALAHFMSGANLGGGVAYVGTFCQPTGVAVSGNLHGQTPIPVPSKSSLTWDFVVCAHETGHNFGSPHTHDYCPPIDMCYPGLCSPTTQCITNGTIMGYCHLCPGGMNNVETVFHPRCGSRMSKVISVSCICTACPCIPPGLTSATPNAVPAYVPFGQQVILTGKRMSFVNAVYVDGVPLAPGTFSADSYTQVSFTMPRVSRTGTVSVFVEDDCGPSPSVLIDVQPPTEPQLGVSVTPALVNSTTGLPVVVGGQPGDVSFVLWSTDNQPTVLPGYLSLDIGSNFSTLFSLWTVTIPAKAWEAQTFPVNGPFGMLLYLQAGVLHGPGAFPLESTGVVPVIIWI